MSAGSRGGIALIGWQTLLADLSLILFMVTAAAMAVSPPRSAPRRPPQSPAVRSAPLAVWRAGGSQPLAQWLAQEQPDARQQLTITVEYAPGDAPRALTAAQAMVGEAGAPGQSAQIIIVPASAGAPTAALASLAYDRAPGSSAGVMARDLRDRSRNPARNFTGRTPS